jgi:shikimate kinase
LPLFLTDFELQGTSLFLVGMMGSGKSTVGRMLASVLKYCFFDSDSVIEQAVGGATVSDIFRENGEEGFRDLETAVLRELSAYRNCVVATGGGAVVRCASAMQSTTTTRTHFLHGHGNPVHVHNRQLFVQCIAPSVLPTFRISRRAGSLQCVRTTRYQVLLAAQEGELELDASWRDGVP